MVDRIRSLPTSRSAYLVGHFIAEFGAAMLGLVIMIVTGLIIGWGVHSGFADALAGVALLALFASAMIWLGTLVGVMVRTPDAVQGVAFMVIFPMTFLSNAFVPVSGLPNGLRQVAEYNPISAIVAATRTLFGNPTAIPDGAAWPLQQPVLSAFLWTGAILAITVPLTVTRFRSRTTE